MTITILLGGVYCTGHEDIAAQLKENVAYPHLGSTWMVPNWNKSGESFLGIPVGEGRWKADPMLL